MVATADLTVSLSCLGVTGALIQHTSTTSAAAAAVAAAIPSRPSEKHSTAGGAFLRCCAAGAAENTPLPPVENPGSIERADGEREKKPERQAAVAENTPGGCDFITGERAMIERPMCKDCASKKGGWREPSGALAAGGDSWICAFNPRDGSLREVAAASAVKEVAADTVPDDDTRGHSAGGGIKTITTDDDENDDDNINVENVNVTAGAERAPSMGGQDAAHGIAADSEATADATPGNQKSCISPGSPVSAALAPAPAPSAMAGPELTSAMTMALATGTPLAESTTPEMPFAPTAAAPAASASSELDRLSPLTVGISEACPGVDSGPGGKPAGGIDAMVVVDTESAAAGRSDEADDTAAAAETARVIVVPRRETSGRLFPGALEKREKIELDR